MHPTVKVTHSYSASLSALFIHLVLHKNPSWGICLINTRSPRKIQIRFSMLKLTLLTDIHKNASVHSHHWSKNCITNNMSRDFRFSSMMNVYFWTPPVLRVIFICTETIIIIRLFGGWLKAINLPSLQNWKSNLM